MLPSAIISDCSRSSNDADVLMPGRCSCKGGGNGYTGIHWVGALSSGEARSEEG